MPFAGVVTDKILKQGLSFSVITISVAPGFAILFAMSVGFDIISGSADNDSFTPKEPPHSIRDVLSSLFEVVTPILFIPF